MSASIEIVVLTVALALTSTEVSEDKKPADPAASEKPGTVKPQAKTDTLGDPLPEGALCRLGTLRFRYGWGISNLLPARTARRSSPTKRRGP